MYHTSTFTDRQTQPRVKQNGVRAVLAARNKALKKPHVAKPNANVLARPPPATKPVPARIVGTPLADVPNDVLARDLHKFIRQCVASTPVEEQAPRVISKLNYMLLDLAVLYRAYCSEIVAARASGREMSWKRLFRSLPNSAHDQNGKPTSSSNALHLFCDSFLLPYLNNHLQDAGGAAPAPQQQQEQAIEAIESAADLERAATPQRSQPELAADYLQLAEAQQERNKAVMDAFKDAAGQATLGAFADGDVSDVEAGEAMDDNDYWV